MDSDIAVEALLAREIWREKSFTPDHWLGSTERIIVGMPLLASLFYGLTGSMQMAAGIACVILGVLLSGVIYVIFRKLQISRTGSLTALLVLYAIPTNGFRNEGQIVPFVEILLFLFADYYALHCILLFLTAYFYMHLKQGGGKKEIAAWVFLFFFTVGLSFGGQRCLYVIILPLVLLECVSLFMESKRFKKRLCKERFWATAFVGSLAAAYGISCLYHGQADYVVYMLSPKELVQKAFLQVPAAFLEGFGISGGGKVGGVDSVMQLLTWAFIILIVYGVIFILRKTNGIEERRREYLLILLVSLGTTAIIISISSAEAAHYYFFTQWFAASLVVALLVDCFRKEKSAFAEVIICAVCLFAAFNIGYTYKDAVLTKDNLSEYEEVADFLEKEGIEYGYAQFWDADRLCLIMDGAVTMGHCYSMDDLRMYWWTTSTDWYPPALPTEMETAYVVKNDMREGFEKQFRPEDKLEIRFENEVFSVYLSDKNYVNAY